MNIKIAMVLTVVGIMTLCLVVTKPSTNHAFAAGQMQATCDLDLKADPGSKALAAGESVEQKLSGTLTCGGTALKGATISFSGLPPGMAGVVLTDSSGNFQGPSFRVHAGDSFSPVARFAGDSEHGGAGAREEIHMSALEAGEANNTNSTK